MPGGGEEEGDMNARDSRSSWGGVHLLFVLLPLPPNALGTV